MSKKSAYLAGPIDRVSTKDASGWRKRLTKLLRPIGIECKNPLTKYGNKINRVRKNLSIWYDEKEYIQMREWGRKYIVNPDFQSVKYSDMVIIYLPTGVEVCGTYAELGLAYYLKKDIYIVSSRHKLPKWAIICSTEIFTDFLELVEYLTNKYGDGE